MEHKISFPSDKNFDTGDAITCIHTTEGPVIYVSPDKYTIIETGKQKTINYKKYSEQTDRNLVYWVILEDIISKEKFIVYNYQKFTNKDEQEHVESLGRIINFMNEDSLPFIICGYFTENRNPSDNIFVSKFEITENKSGILTLKIKNYTEYFINFDTELLIEKEANLCDYVVKLYPDDQKAVNLYDLEKGKILSIPYGDKEHGEKLMKQIFAKYHGCKVRNFLNDAPKEIIDFKPSQDWCFCLMTDGDKIEGNLIINPPC